MENQFFHMTVCFPEEVMAETQTVISCPTRPLFLPSSMLSVRNNLCLSGALRFRWEATH